MNCGLHRFRKGTAGSAAKCFYAEFRCPLPQALLSEGIASMRGDALTSPHF